MATAHVAIITYVYVQALRSPIPNFESSNLDRIELQPFDEDLLHSPSFIFYQLGLQKQIKKKEKRRYSYV